MLKTRLTNEYGIDFPFVSAGMGFIALPELVAAVSNAGGLGLLGVAVTPPPILKTQIDRIRSLTSNPFGVDLIYENTAMGPASTEQHIDVCVEARVKVVVFFWNLPPSAWIDRLKAAGVRVWMTVGTVRQAREAAAASVDAVIAQGTEAGGHNKSTVGLLTLVPSIVDAVAGLPVIAAGGIASGRAVAAALALGADGVCVGTRLLASHEAYAHDEYKRRIVEASETDIATTALFGPEWPDQPMRVIRNRVVREWAGRDAGTPPQPNPPAVIGKTILAGHEYSMPKFSAALPTPDTVGDFDEMCLAAGDGAAIITRIQPAAEIVHEMMAEAERALRERAYS
jgi:NAD(P)H-dependent flavin oxidoreductase YrpB (nitropropane dioxygenase family)